MKVGDEDLGFFQFLAEVFGNEVEGAVEVAWIVGQQDAKPVADGDARSHDQERIGEAAVLMTRVLPLPVAILKAMRKSSGFASSLALRRSFSIQASPYLAATSAR